MRFRPSSSAPARVNAVPRAPSAAPSAALSIARNAASGAALLACVAWLSVPPAFADERPAPSVELQPAEVVEIVVDALQRNPELEDDAGIRTVFRFASPGNRAMTGPVERFATMIKRGYGDMLGFASSRFDTIEVEQDTALQVVWLRQASGRETGYAFKLGLQSGGEYDGMWMTDAVLPLGEGPGSGTSI